MRLELTQSRRIDADPDILFGVLSDPRSWPRINDKIRSLTVRDDGVITGSIAYRGEEIEYAGRIVDTEPPERIEAVLVFRAADGERNDMELTYRIEPTRRGSKVTETLRFDREIPYWAWLLIRIVQRWGRSAGPTHLERLETLVEAPPGG